MKTALLLLFLLGSPQWALVRFPELLDSATLVVAGEVIGIRQTAEGRPVARFQVARTLKGKPATEVLDIPFKVTTTWACDFTIEYTKGAKYLLLIDDHADFRVVYYPRHTFTEIPDYESPAVIFAALACDIQAGRNPEARIPELIAEMKKPARRGDAFDLFEGIPRRQARPYLKAVREVHSLVPANPARPSSAGILVHRDLSLVRDLIAAPRNGDATLLKSLSLLTGWTVGDTQRFQEAWTVAIDRSEAHGRAKDAEALVPTLASPLAGERDKAMKALLDLGPDVLETVKAHARDGDAETRARIAEAVQELELLGDLRDDWAARRARK